ncbi:MAG: hypothetical protein COA36_16680 [Desulfotalea sp.]|nr:MAG: hypothetical protein COA36_16680 [Desulfotalea sp.]
MNNSIIVLAVKLTLNNGTELKPSNKHWRNKVEGNFTRGNLAPYLRHMVERANNATDEMPVDHHYEVDEEATLLFLEKRKENQAKRVKRKEVDSVGVSGLAEMIGKAINPSSNTNEIEALKKELAEAKAKITTPKEQPKESKGTDYSAWSLEELKSYCDSMEYKYHHAHKEEALIKLINENK